MRRGYLRGISSKGRGGSGEGDVVVEEEEDGGYRVGVGSDYVFMPDVEDDEDDEEEE